VDDLRDQSEWSSYTQDIPRLGNPSREEIRLGRYRRAFRNLSNPRSYRSSPLWTIARVALILAVVSFFIAAVLVVLTDA
jgi:hypothetical protein